METKKCSKCGIEKPIIEFSKDKHKKDGYKSNCKTCSNNSFAKWEENNKEKRIEYRKKYTKKNEDKIKQKQKNYREENKERIIEMKKKWYYKNKERQIKKSTEYKRNRKKVDLIFKFKDGIRCLVKNSIKKQGYSKTSKTANILGCTYDEFIVHIENQFEIGRASCRERV